MKRLVLILALAGCEPAPDLGPVADSGPAPAQLPLDEVNARAGTARSDAATAASLDARGEALRARAAALR